METIRRMMKRIRVWRPRWFNTSHGLLSDISENDNSNDKIVHESGHNSLESSNDTSRNSSNDTSKSSSTRRRSNCPNERSRFFRRSRIQKSKSVPCYVGSQLETSHERQDTSDSSGATYAALDNSSSSSSSFNFDVTWSTTSSVSSSSSSLDSDLYLGLSRMSLSDVTLSKRREAILETLVKLEVLTPEDSASISASADNQLLKVAFENVKPNLTYVWFNNFVGMPEHLNLSPCFIDYLNFRCSEANVLENLLQRPVNFAVTESADAKVSDLLEIDDVAYYSFCQGRAVFSSDFRHCPHCHVCTVLSYKHCSSCNRCSVGLHMGTRCEHCNFTLPMPNESNPSLASFSELQETLTE